MRNGRLSFNFFSFVWLITTTDRAIKRYRDEGRFSDKPDTKQQADS